MLTHDDKRTRVLWFWEKAFKRARGAAYIIKQQLFQNTKVFIDGYSNKSNVNYL